MGRRGRSSPAPARSFSNMPARRVAPPAAAPPPSSLAHPPPHSGQVMQQKQPSMFSQMAATAGGVAVGSAIGHTVGHALTGAFSGSSPAATTGNEPPQPQQPTATPTEPCAWEIKEFLKCAQDQSDLSLCEGFNEALRQCKLSHGLKY